MRMAKTEELKQDIEILSQSFDRNVDRKDALIQVRCSQLISNVRSNYAACFASWSVPLPITIKQVILGTIKIGHKMSSLYRLLTEI